MVTIFPCAGQSSRFPGTRPKYLLTDYSGKIMVERAALGIQGPKVFVVLQEHVEQYDSENILIDTFGDIGSQIIILEKPTNGPAETVYQALQQLDFQGPFLIRDCDSFFSFDTQSGNVVYTSKLSNNLDLKGVSQLSYVICNDQNIVSNIVEKRVASDDFCVGGYQFENKESYMKAYEAIKSSGGELFISNIIGYMITQGEVFMNKEVQDYVNVGVLEAWQKFNDRPTIFCDIDGVVVYNQASVGKNSYNRSIPVPIKENIEQLHRLMNNGSQIIFVTARSKEFHKVTRKMLDDIGFSDCDLIMGLHHSKRILINDFAESNQYPTAIAINLERNTNKLKNYLKV